jgi:hypothetical protein
MLKRLLFSPFLIILTNFFEVLNFENICILIKIEKILFFYDQVFISEDILNLKDFVKSSQFSQNLCFYQIFLVLSILWENKILLFWAIILLLKEQIISEQFQKF